jgi:hypothetical protein
MLDWFSRSRLKNERRNAIRTPEPGQSLRDYTFVKPDGTRIQLSSISGALTLILLPNGRVAGETYLVHQFGEKFSGVCSQQTRVLVVVRMEDLSTVVALAGDLLILADEAGDAMLELGVEDDPVVYELGVNRVVLRIVRDPIAA